MNHPSKSFVRVTTKGNDVTIINSDYQKDKGQLIGRVALSISKPYYNFKIPLKNIKRMDELFLDRSGGEKRIM